MKKILLLTVIMAVFLAGCIPGTRKERMYQDRMIGNTVIESGDTRLSTDNIGQNIYVGYIAHIDNRGNIIDIIMEVTYNASDWLFYNACWLKIGDNEIIKKTGIIPDREIIGVSNLMERGSFLINEDTLLSIINKDKGLIRVIGQRGYVEGEINESLRKKTREFAKKIKLIN